MRILTFCGWVAGLTALAMPVAAANNNSAAEYLGGTVKSIPPNTVGSLDLADPADLVFRYGKAVYRLSFLDIKSFQLDADKGPRRHLGQVSLPNLSWASHVQTLNLSYRTRGSAVGVLSFKLSGKGFASAQWILKTRTEKAQEDAANGSRAKLPESWWGDRYWRTSRNSVLWGTPESEAQTGTR